MVGEDIKSKGSLLILVYIVVFYYTNSVLFRFAFLGFGRHHLWLWLLAAISFAVSSHMLHKVIFQHQHAGGRLPIEMILGMAISAVLIIGMTYLVAYYPWPLREDSNSSLGGLKFLAFAFVPVGFFILFHLVKFILTNEELGRDSLVLRKMQEVMRKWGFILVPLIVTNGFLLAFGLEPNLFDGIGNTAVASLVLSFTVLLLGWVSINMLCGIEKRLS